MAKAKRSNKSKVKNLNENGNTQPKDVEIFEESIFTTRSGIELKCFPVDSIVINGEESKLKKSYEAQGLSLDAPIIKIPSMPGAADVEIELSNEDICKIEGNEEETDRRLALYNEWQETLTQYNKELEANKFQCMLTWGLWDRSFFGLPQPGGLKVPNSFKGQIELLGVDWPEEEAEQFFLYLTQTVLNNASDTMRVIGNIGFAANTGMVTMEQYEVAQAGVNATFRNILAKQNERKPLSVGEGGEGDDPTVESGELAV